MKVITLNAPLNAMLTFSRIVEAYVEAAYPPGGSECAQSAREALLLAAGRLQNEYDNVTGAVTISRRIKAHLKSALSYSADSQERQDGRMKLQRELLLKCLNGEEITDESWNATTTAVI